MKKYLCICVLSALCGVSCQTYTKLHLEFQPPSTVTESGSMAIPEDVENVADIIKTLDPYIRKGIIKSLDIEYRKGFPNWSEGKSLNFSGVGK